MTVSSQQINHAVPVPWHTPKRRLAGFVVGRVLCVVVVSLLPSKAYLAIQTASQ
jgi:hypothetical protein